MRGRDASVRQRATDYRQTHGCFTFSVITRYEILRGLKAKQATAQITAFHFARVPGLTCASRKAERNLRSLE